MHIVEPARLRPPVESVAAFSCDPEELAERLSAVNVDQLAAAGPARLGAIELAGGATVGVVVHEHGRFAELLAQVSTNVESTIVESFRVLGVSVNDVEWIRDDIDKSAIIGALRSTGNERTSPVRFELAPQFEAVANDMVLTSAEAQALTLLVLRLARAPHLSASIGETGIHMLRVSHTLIADGTEIAPLAIFYQLEPDNSVVILDVQRLAASDLFITGATFLDVATDIAGHDPVDGRDQVHAAPVLYHRPKTVSSALIAACELLSRAS